MYICTYITIYTRHYRTIYMYIYICMYIYIYHSYYNYLYLRFMSFSSPPLQVAFLRCISPMGDSMSWDDRNLVLKWGRPRVTEVGLHERW